MKLLPTLNHVLFFLKSTLLCRVNFEKGCRPTPGRVLFIFGMNTSISSQLHWRVSKRDSTSLKTVETKTMGFLLATFYVALFAVNVGYQILRNMRAMKTSWKLRRGRILTNARVMKLS